MRSFLSLALIFVLTGCYASAPTPMPRGYSSYDKEIKSVAGANARNIGYDYSHDKNEAVLNEMRPITSSLVTMLGKKIPFATADKIYLEIPANTAFYNSFDYLLRAELMRNGYILTSSPNDAVRVDFVAKKLKSDCDIHNIYLALAIDTVDNIPSELVGGFYNAPLYGYRPAGRINIDIPSCLSE